MNQKRDCINWRQIIPPSFLNTVILAREEPESEFKVAKETICSSRYSIVKFIGISILTTRMDAINLK
jgi:hypothetical protein